VVNLYVGTIFWNPLDLLNCRFSARARSEDRRAGAKTTISARKSFPSEPRTQPNSIAPMGDEMSQDFLPETETPVPIIRGPGEGKVVGVLRDQSTFKVLSEETGGAYAILEQKIPAGHGPPLHVHRHETEIFYVLDGRFEITIGEQKLSAGAGAIVVGPRNIPHTFRNIGSQDARLLLTVIPGRFANYFIEVDGVDDANPAAIKALLAKYEVEIIE
jgi:quercetin dioxygenase-like cupin family protein